MDEDDIDTLNAAILANAQKPASASVDGNSVSQHNLQAQIAAANHIAGTVAAGTGKFGLRFSTLVPPGCG